jgi:hypothetical protein
MEYDENVTKAQMKLAEWANDNQEPDEFATLSFADAHHLSEEQFRARFCTVVREFIVEWGRRWTEEICRSLRGPCSRYVDDGRDEGDRSAEPVLV